MLVCAQSHYCSEYTCTHIQDGRTALCTIAQEGLEDGVKLFLAAKADSELKDKVRSYLVHIMTERMDAPPLTTHIVCREWPNSLGQFIHIAMYTTTYSDLTKQTFNATVLYCSIESLFGQIDGSSQMTV